MKKILTAIALVLLIVLIADYLRVSKELGATTPDYQGYESAYDKGVEDTLIEYNLK